MQVAEEPEEVPHETFTARMMLHFAQMKAGGTAGDNLMHHAGSSLRGSWVGLKTGLDRSHWAAHTLP